MGWVGQGLGSGPPTSHLSHSNESPPLEQAHSRHSIIIYIINFLGPLQPQRLFFPTPLRPGQSCSKRDGSGGGVVRGPLPQVMPPQLPSVKCAPATSVGAMGDPNSHETAPQEGGRLGRRWGEEPAVPQVGRPYQLLADGGLGPGG